MNFWNWLLGLDSDATDAGQWSLHWAAELSGDAAFVMIVAAVVIVLGVISLYRLERERVGIGHRIGMSTLRLAALGIGAAMLLGPVLVRQVEEEIPSHVVVLTDVSNSMTVHDAWADETMGQRVAEVVGVDGLDALRATSRYEITRRVLGDGLADELRGRSTNVERESNPTESDDGSVETDSSKQDVRPTDQRVVHIHPFGDRLNGEVETLDEQPSATSVTALGSAVREALRDYAGRPLAGVVILSDGASNGGDRLDTAAKSVSEAGVPVYTVPIGTVEGPRNAFIAGIDAPPVVFTGDDAEVSVRVQSQGMQDQSATLAVEKRVNGGVWQEIERFDLVLELGGAVETVTLPFKEDRSAKVEFRATLSDVGPELTDDDNVALGSTQVVREKLNVLFLAGSTFPEVQFLRQMLMLDRTIDVSTWNQSAGRNYKQPGDVPIRRLPVTAEEINAYDCIVLYDPDPRRWPENFGELLAQFVGQAGGGLVLIAGEMQTSTLFDRQDDPTMEWLRMMPVVREPGLFRSKVQIKLAQTNPWRLAITAAGTRDPILQFVENPDENVRVLENLPGMFWHFPVTRAKPGAEVLAVHGDPRMRNEYGPEVVIATQRVGPGRTLFVGCDSTYRWRYANEEYFNGFWRRVIDRGGRNKRLGGGYPFKLATGKTDFVPGTEVRVFARFLDATGPDATIDELLGDVQRGSDEPMPLSLRPTERPGEFAGTFVPDAAGTHLVRVFMGDNTVGARAATMAVDVVLPSAELASPAVNRESLATLASAGRGEVVDLADIDTLAKRLSIGRVKRTIEERHELWDAPLLWFGLFTLLCVEWVWRKRVRLI